MRVCGNCAELTLFSQFRGRCKEKEISEEGVKYKATVRHIEDLAEECPRFKKTRQIVVPQKRFSD